MFGFGLLSAISAIFTATELVREATEKPVSKNVRFDWEAYDRDVANGVGSRELLAKRKRGEYNTTKPKPQKSWELPYDAVVDVERYERDKKQFCESYVEMKRKIGDYKYIRDF